MNPVLKTLIELQRLDHAMRGLESEIQSLPRKIAAIESQLTEHIAKVDSDKKKIAENQRERRRRESEIAALRDKISKHKSQMLEVKTNEQYRALQHEIEFHDAAIRKLEDEILVEMIESETLERQLRQTEKDLGEERSRGQGEIRVAEQRRQSDEEKLKAARSEHDQARTALSEDLYESYERILMARKGTAVAEVRYEACGACHVRLRPQAYNDVMTNQEILHCESCGCIMYYVPPPDPEPREIPA